MGPRTNRKLRVVSAPSTELAALVDDFIAAEKSRGLAPASIKASKDRLEGVFLRWAAKQEVTATEQLDQGVLDAFSRYLLEEHRTLKDKPLSRESARSYLRDVRQFVGWAQRRGDLGKMKVPMPKAPERMVDVLTREEILDMERAATSDRDKIIIRLLADTGIRLGELLGLRREDLKRDKDSRFIHVKGKGDKERLVPIKPQLFDRLEKYSKRPQARSAESGRLFLTDRKRAGAYGALSGRTVQQMVKFTAEAAGIDTTKRRIHPHLFRHSAITWMVNSGDPVEHIRRTVGHADLSLITKVYSHTSPSDLYKTMLERIRRDEDER